MIRFEDIEFLPETESLFCEMVEAAVQAKSSAGRRFLLSKHLSGNSLIFLGPPRHDWDDVEEAALNDLVAYGLLQLEYGSRGTPNFLISNDGHRYYRYLQQQRGSALAQVEETVHRAIEGESFSQQYPNAARALAKATELLWRGETSDQVASELGAALRAALQDFVDELLGRHGFTAKSSREKPVARLQELTDSIADRFGDREPATLKALLELARVVLREVQRIHHVRNEGRIDRWDEMRRASFLVAVVLYEFDRAVESSIADT